MLYDELKRKYADLLHMWNLLEARAQVTKLLSAPADSHRGVEFLTECQQCKKSVFGSAACSSCKRLTLRCAVCRILVRGKCHKVACKSAGASLRRLLVLNVNEMGATPFLPKKLAKLRNSEEKFCGSEISNTSSEMAKILTLTNTIS